jgi:hypothetical protein
MMIRVFRLRHRAWWIAGVALMCGCAPSPKQTTADRMEASALGTTAGPAAISDTLPRRDTMPIPSPKDTIPRPPR